MPVKSIFVLAVAALGAPSVALAADLSGAWLVNGNFSPNLTYTLVCVLKSQRQDLWGPCATIQEKAKPTTCYTSCSKMTFRYHTDYNGSGVRLVYHGDVQPDGTVKGKVNGTGNSEGVFEAKALTDIVAGKPVTWKVSAAFSESIKYVLLCTFKSDGADLGGSCAVTAGDSLVAKGSLDGTKMSLQYDTVFQGKPVHVDYAGAVQSADVLSGTIKAGASTGTFTAQRQ